MTLTLAGLAALTLAQGAPAADTQTSETSDVIKVTSVRLPVLARESGTALTVIGRTELDQTAFLVETLAAAPGVTINQTGAFGGASTVRIRGASGGQTLVLIDGVPVNDATSPGGAYNFAALDPDAVERIEVLRGAQSVLWGSDAIGGVVAIETRRAAPGTGVSGFVEAGSFDTLRGGAAFEASGEPGALRLGVTSTATGGISKADERDGNTERDRFDAVTLHASGRLELGEAGQLDLAARQTRARTEYDSFGAVTGVEDGDEFDKTRDRSASLRWSNSFAGDSLTTSALIGYADIERDAFANGAFSFDARGERVTGRLDGAWTLQAGHRLAAGLDLERSKADGESSRQEGLFVLGELRPAEGVVLTGGVRRDESDRYGGATTGRVSASVQAAGTLRLRANAGTGFKAPSIFQTTFFCCGAAGPNTDLKAERSAGYDIGADLALAGGAVMLEATWFAQDITDLIDFSFAAGGYENIARADTSGVELGARVRLAQGWSASASYTWLEAEDGDGNRLARLPRHTADAALSYTQELWGATLSGRYNSSETDSFGTAGAWTRLDFNAHYQLTPRLQLYGRVENLLDRHYQQVFGFGTPGRSAWVGVRLSR
ncbi:TonB-dependent receptor plug domain-containing protein [Alkalicaulis satelles]|uniref:TonB-dependent receptor plug domain-containing protein n=1 Tax=Alkalicaulis satelles TaxID=2609175 RepID=UPI0018EA719B|nr:TonB-dependent receptor [Alkalicaulis satelles]